MNARIGTPEIVVVGKEGSGKTSFLEAFMGTALFPVEEAQPTKRPFYFQVVQNSNCKTPKVTIKRDTKNAEFGELEVSLSDLPAALAKRNLVSEEPVYVNYEYQHAWNLTLIDMPPLITEAKGGVTPEQREALLNEQCKPAKRLIVSIEKSREDGSSEMVDFLKHLDPRLDRTIFVFTDLCEVLKVFTSGSASSNINRFLTSGPRPNTSFWVSLVTGSSRKKYTGDSELFREKIEQQSEGDSKVLEQLKYDIRYKK